MTLLTQGNVFGDDGYFGNKGAIVFPVEHEDIRLVREIVTFEQTQKSRIFAARAELIFFNPVFEDLDIQVGFPSMSAEGVGTRSFEDTLVVTVNGEPVSEIELRSVDPTGNTPWDKIYFFDATFPGNRHTTIINEFPVHDSGTISGDSRISYVLRSGATWAGQMDEAIFQYIFNKPPWHVGFVYGKSFLAGWPLWPGFYENRISPNEIYVGPENYVCDYMPGPRPVFTITFQDFEPQYDIELCFLKRPGLPALQLLDLYIVEDDNTRDCLKNVQSLSRFLDTLELDDELLSSCGPSFLRNFIYASRGYHFHDPELHKAFYETGIFLPSTVPFDPTWLTPEEVQAIEQLRQLELAEEPDSLPIRSKK